jgi:hypothetical protein
MGKLVVVLVRKLGRRLQRYFFSFTRKRKRMCTGLWGELSCTPAVNAAPPLTHIPILDCPFLQVGGGPGTTASGRLLESGRGGSGQGEPKEEHSRDRGNDEGKSLVEKGKTNESLTTSSRQRMRGRGGRERRR